MSGRVVTFDGDTVKSFVVNHRRGPEYSATIHNNTDQSITITVTNQDAQNIVAATGGNITAFADAGGGDITATTDSEHGLSVGSTVTIAGTTNYDGTYFVTAVPSLTEFDFTDTFVATDTGTWASPSQPVFVTPVGGALVVASGDIGALTNPYDGLLLTAAGSATGTLNIYEAG